MKWYEDPIYIKMCVKAEEIQERWEPENNDKAARYYSKRSKKFFVRDIYRSFIYRRRDKPQFKKLYKWLPTQSQLQEMMEERPSPKLFARFVAFLGWDGVTFCGNRYPMVRPPEFTSMEQLWLAFVMHEKYNHKVWDSEKEEWVE